MDFLLCNSDMKIAQIPRLWAYKGEREMFRKDDVSRWKVTQKKLKRNVLEHMLKVCRLQDCQEKCFARAGKLSAHEELVKMAVASLPKYRGSEQMKSQMKRVRHLRAEQLRLRSKVEDTMQKFNTLLAAEKKLRCKIEKLSSCLQVEIEEILRRQVVYGFRRTAGTDLSKVGEIQQHVRTLYEMTSKSYVFSSLPDTVTDCKVQKRVDKTCLVKSLWNKHCAIPVNERMCQLNGADSRTSSKDSE